MGREVRLGGQGQLQGGSAARGGVGWQVGEVEKCRASWEGSPCPLPPRVLSAAALPAFALLPELTAMGELRREREWVVGDAEGSVGMPWHEVGRTPAPDSGTSEDLLVCHHPLGCSSSAAAPHHPRSTASSSLPRSWCCARAGLSPSSPSWSFSLRKGFPDPRCVHGGQRWGQSMARRSGHGWEAGGCLCWLAGSLISGSCLSPAPACLGPVTFQRHRRWQEVGAGLHCGLMSLKFLVASKAVAHHPHHLLPAAFTPSLSLSIPGADTMSETSSISMEATTDSRDTSVATSILLPFPPSRGREEADNRSEHSYSESGASGSSFEELDLEVTVDGEGAPGLLPDVGYAGNQEVTDKWTKEPIAAERGEE